MPLPSIPNRPGANGLTAPDANAFRPNVRSSVNGARVMEPVDRTKVDPTLLKAAEGMEAMFLDYMMRVMRQTVPKGGMDLESPATEVYRSMLDSETAQRAARSGGVGLADQIIAYLQTEKYNQGQSSERRTGGTHAGQSANE